MNEKTKLPTHLEGRKDTFSVQALRCLYLQSFSGRAHRRSYNLQERTDVQIAEWEKDCEYLIQFSTPQWEALSSPERMAIIQMEEADRWAIADSLEPVDLQLGTRLAGVDADTTADFHDAYVILNKRKGAEARFPAFLYLLKNEEATGYALAIADLMEVLKRDDWSIKSLPSMLTDKGITRYDAEDDA